MNTPARLCVVLAGALWMAAAVCATPPSSDPDHPQPQSREHRDGRRHQQASPMQSEAMQDALGVAMQAFRFAASHPDANEADKQAKANEIMSRLFQRELNDGAPSSGPETTAPQDDNGG